MRMGRLPVNLLVSVALMAASASAAGPAPVASTQAGTGDSGLRRAEMSAQRPPRPHLVIRPHRFRPGPTARRFCRAWLAQEYRLSGPVIVPQMRCWWEQ